MRIAQIILVAAVLVFLPGCREDPNDKAVSQLQKETSKTFKQYVRSRDAQAAGQQLDTLSQSRAGGQSQDPAILGAADMQLAIAQQEQTALMLQISALNKSIGAIEQALGQLSNSAARLESTRNMLALADAEVVEIEKYIDSQLKSQIAQARLNASELAEKRAVVEGEFQQARDTMLAIEADAQKNLRQAQTATGQSKAQLEKAGFDLKNQKKEYYIKVQEAENALAELDSELAIVQPHLKRLEENLQTSQETLTKLKNATSRIALQAQQQEITAQISRQKDWLKQKNDEFTAQLAQHQQESDKILTSVNEAIEKYQKIKSRQLNPSVSMSLGQAYALAGSVLAFKVYTASELGWRVDGVFRVYQPALPEGLPALTAPKIDIETAKKAMEYFDMACEQYEKAEAGSGQLRQGAQKAACAALKGRLLALHNKIRLADRISDFDTAEKTQTQLDQAIEKSKEYGALFSQSATAMLLSKGIEYIPILPVDSAIVLEGIKKDFVSWRALRGPEAETEVERLLKHIDQLEKEYPGDEQIGQFLTQEKQAIEEAKTKGFAPEPEPETASQEPNTV